jgi:hypothetical protein
MIVPTVSPPGKVFAPANYKIRAKTWKLLKALIYLFLECKAASSA